MSESEDNEVLPEGNDLSKYMISEGFSDFETYKQHSFNENPNISSHYKKAHSSSEPKNNLDCRTIQPICVSSYDHSKLLNLLNSKLLLPEDFELIEFVTSKIKISTRQTSLWVYSGGVIASTITLALYLGKRVSFHLPGALTSLFSFLCLKQCYDGVYGIYENRSFTSAISTLQNLCVIVHKLLRLLKETEILSTGQITTHNVGAALYIPVKNIEELETLPSWKTLPHLRKYLASTLLEIIDLLKLSCDEARKIVPNWLNIEGYTFSNESSMLNAHPSVYNLCSTESCISLKDLQLLNDSYLILQSELLRWIGFCICPSVWNTSDPNYRTSRIKILDIFFNTTSQLSDISFKLKMHYDIQGIFSEGQQLIKQRVTNNDILEISNLQSELHNLFSLILSLLTRLKNFEDQLENNSNSGSDDSLSSLKETMNKKLKDVRDELECAVNVFDTICHHTFANKKPSPIQSDNLEKEHSNHTIFRPQINTPEVNSNQSDCHINSLDEVFLAITDFNSKEQEKYRDDWDIESKPSIPNTLLEELSTTLKPIKEHFKEREKVALERAGLEDINNESGSDTNVTDKNSRGTLSTRSVPKRKKKRIRLKINYNSTCAAKETQSDSSTSMEDFSVQTHSEVNPVQSISVGKNNSSTSFPVLNDKSIANLIAMKSQSWGLAEEECFSDD